jgi:hypothetical protein
MVKHSDLGFTDGVSVFSLGCSSHEGRGAGRALGPGARGPCLGGRLGRERGASARAGCARAVPGRGVWARRGGGRVGRVRAGCARWASAWAGCAPTRAVPGRGREARGGGSVGCPTQPRRRCPVGSEAQRDVGPSGVRASAAPLGEDKHLCAPVHAPPPAPPPPAESSAHATGARCRPHTSPSRRAAVWPSARRTLRRSMRGRPRPPDLGPAFRRG